eukprot:TRINITY_DN18350_c0_g2_i3.p1 TRINITY_DN18350_c0_g2~~TRINITY_DN18350_c0_g2_i3.p1  ORF type:complete len:692 (-),score=153.52 TRINITY_DN18350_c0_g2_i3:194-2269(-)
MCDEQLFNIIEEEVTRIASLFNIPVDFLDKRLEQCGVPLFGSDLCASAEEIQTSESLPMLQVVDNTQTTEECVDVPPSSDFTCQQQADFGKCNAEFMLSDNFCAQTCNRAPCCSIPSEVLGSTEELSVLSKALSAVGLDLDQFTFDVTVFAPTNVAFIQLIKSLGIDEDTLFADTELLAKVLDVHVVPDFKLLSKDISEGVTLGTRLSGSRLHPMLNQDGSVTVQSEASNTTVLIPDVQACNMVVHVIDTVLLPDMQQKEEEVAETDESVFDKKESNESCIQLQDIFEQNQGELSSLLRFVNALDLDLTSFAPLTILAPSRRAFQKLFKKLDTNGRMLEQGEALLTDILQLHLLPNTVLTSHTLLPGFEQKVQSAHKQNGRLDIRVSEAGDIQISSVGSVAKVQIPDIQGCDVVVHVIDTVLLPFQVDDEADVAEGVDGEKQQSDGPNTIAQERKFSQTESESEEQEETKQQQNNITVVDAQPTCVQPSSIVSSNQDFSILLQALTAAQINLDIASPKTIFAPTNQAFETLFQTLRITPSELISDETLLKQILQLHVVPDAIAPSGVFTKDSIVMVPTTLSLDEMETDEFSGNLQVFKNDQDDVVVESFGSTAQVVVADVEACNAVIHIVDTVLLPLSFVSSSGNEFVGGDLSTRLLGFGGALNLEGRDALDCLLSQRNRNPALRRAGCLP